MTLALINAAASVLTLLVFATSVSAAVLQLRHMRAANELAAVLAIEHDFRTPEIQAALTFVQTELPERLRDPVYCAELSEPGFIDARRHPEMLLCNWFNRSGALVRRGFLKEELFFGTFGRLVEYYWLQLDPVIELLRRTRGPGQYRSFELLALQARRLRLARRPQSSYPRNARRLAVPDPWPRDPPTSTAVGN